MQNLIRNVLSAIILICMVRLHKCLKNHWTGQRTPTPRFILKAPGDCLDHPDWPGTIQCARTGFINGKHTKCISLDQFRDGTQDCVDNSDENRLDPPGNDSCRLKNPEMYELGLMIQCANTGLCLTALDHSADGVCDCCGPDKNCDTCDDHSDEDICTADLWKGQRYDPLPPGFSKDHKKLMILAQHFSCDNKCLSVQQYMYDLNRNATWDCMHECAEPDFKEECIASLKQQQSDVMKEFCSKLDQKRTPYYKCENELRDCVILPSIRDGIKNCRDGEDESSIIHPNCSEEQWKAHCDDQTELCIAVNNGEFIYCGCKEEISERPSSFKGKTKSNCNKIPLSSLKK